MKRWVWIAFFACVGIGISYQRALLFPSGTLEQLSSYLVYPILQAQKNIVLPIKIKLEEKKSRELLEQNIATIRCENDRLKAENIELQAALRYAHDIQELAEFKKQYNYPEAILAHVLAKNISEQTHFLLLDVGANKGIKKNMVAVYNNALLGKVVEVYPWYCKLQLITDRTCKVAACCAATNASGIYAGCNQEEGALLERVSHLAKVQVGDLVLSSGEGLIFPQGFGLGKVSSFKQDGLVYHVNVAPLIDIRSIDYCCLIQKGATLANQESEYVDA